MAAGRLQARSKRKQKKRMMLLRDIVSNRASTPATTKNLQAKPTNGHLEQVSSLHIALVHAPDVLEVVNMQDLAEFDVESK